MMSDLNSIVVIRLVSSKHTIRRKKEEMESKGRTESGVFSYVYIPFSFIHEILQSLFVKFLGVRSPPSNFPKISEEEEVTEVVEVTSRKSQLEYSSGKPGARFAKDLDAILEKRVIVKNNCNKERPLTIPSFQLLAVLATTGSAPLVLYYYRAKMKKGAKRRGASKAGRKGAAVAESQNDEVIAESLEASTQEENQEDGVKDEEEDKQVDEVNGASSSSQQNEDVKDEEDKKKNKPARGGGKRKRATKKGIEVKDEKKPQAPRAKKARVSKPQEEPEYFEDERNLEGLWKAAFPVGTEWDQLDALYEFNWDFKHLEEALEEEDGLLYGKKVFLFGCTEPQLVPFKGANKILHVPAVVAVESPFPPSDKIGITSVQREVEEIIPMKTMKMNWLPYIPVDKRGRQVDRMDFQIFVLGCTRRRAALRHMKEDLVKKYEYCLPYFYQPFTEDELEQSTEVQIMFPSEPPVVCEFDWELDELEEFVDKLIEDEALAAEQKDEFKEYVKEQVRAAKKANREAREARRKAIEDMSEETKQAFQSMKFYKFYPLPSPETPDVSGVKSRFINRYYGKAHEVL
ncbi:unnamed protein product [Brassica rapa]|nr:unnamed protein product [Brassica rapa]